MIRQLERPYRSFLFIEEYGVQAIKSKETKCRCRESDSSVVPMKLGNADGGKACYQLPPLLGTHLLHTEVDLHTEVGLINENKTSKDNRNSK
jgi:hypothetical protein